jgi:lipopolysaccharide/colanic/teichoic acid biosynthesis glycosyltransferase
MMSATKRTFDLLGAVAGLAVLWPLLLAIAIAIRLDDGGSVFFRQTRVGLRGRPFRIWKFRTMVQDAARQGRAITVANDARVTRVGAVLRRCKLDELPQLFNVVAGEMSLVGPRPDVPQYVAQYGPAQQRVLELVPGITSPANLAYHDEAELLARASDPERMYVQQVMPDKIRLHLAYADQATPWSDLLMVLRTVVHILPGAAAMRRNPARPDRAPLLHDARHE